MPDPYQKDQALPVGCPALFRAWYFFIRSECTTSVRRLRFWISSQLIRFRPQYLHYLVWLLLIQVELPSFWNGQSDNIIQTGVHSSRFATDAQSHENDSEIS
ncbi:hypothetical protein T06_6521 [Trichinella sp. T6]|nr:hypothetical protein T06_6521 [Trichinella sp. T6]